MPTEVKRMRQRRDTSANWVSHNPVLLDGEMGYDTTIDRYKIGDGTSTWTELVYADQGPQGATGPSGGPFPDLDGVAAGQVAETTGDGGVQFVPSAPLARAGRDPSEAPLPVGETSVGSLPVAARADHVHASSGLFTLWGDGEDGNVVFDGATAVAGWSRSGSVYTADAVNPRKMFFNNLTIQSGVTVKLGPWPVWVLGTLTVTGVLTNAGAAAAGATKGSPTPLLNSFFYLAGDGATGATGTGAAGATGTTPAAGHPSGSQLWGGAGGAGGASGATAGGATVVGSGQGILGAAGDGFLRLVKSPFYAFNGFMPFAGNNSPLPFFGGSGGSAGAGDGTNAGGGGGAGGEVMLVNARKVVNNGVISTAGGAGGTASAGNAAGGGGGGGGPLLLNTTSLTGAGVITAAGGAGGAGHGTGAAGSAGTAGFAQIIVWS